MNKKILIIILISLGVFAVLSYFVYFPQLQDILSLQQSYLQKKQDLQVLQDKKANLNSLKDQEKEINDFLEKMTKYLPETKSSGDFLVEIEGLASATGNNIIDIAFSEEKKKTTTTTQTSDTTSTASPSPSPASQTTQTGTTTSLKSIDFEIKIEGAYQSIINFIAGLKTLNRYNAVETVNLELTNETIQSLIKGKIYYKKD